MRNTIIILLFPLLSASQGVIIDGSGIITNYTKLADSSSGIYATAYRLKIKTDSLATALAQTNASLLSLKCAYSDTAAIVSGYLRKTSPISFANGGNTGVAATSATTGTMTVSMTTSVITITPTGSCTFNASGGVAGQRISIVITTSGTSSFTLTFGTNFKTVGTIATGTTSGKVWVFNAVCTNGTQWVETERSGPE